MDPCIFGKEQLEHDGNDKPDIDEDRQNPAYIPRKGYFYEHDLRLGNEDSETKANEARFDAAVWL